MPQSIVCRACGAKLRIPDEYARRQAKCPKCMAVIALDSNVMAPATARAAPKSIPVARVAEATPPPGPVEEAEEVVRLEEALRPKKRAREVASDDPVSDTSMSDEEDRPKKKKKKRRRPRHDQPAGLEAWTWWYIGLAGVLGLVVMGGIGLVMAGHGPLVLLCGIELAVAFPVSMVILVISMFLSSHLSGGMDFGEIRTFIPKILILLIIANLINLLPFGTFLAFPVWLIGLMSAFNLDLWEAKFLVGVNWLLNLLLRWTLLMMFLNAYMHNQGKMDSFDMDPPGPQAPSPEMKAIDAIEKLGGSCDDDENAEDIRIIGVHLANSRVTDADLALLKELPALRTLDLSNTQITDQGLTHLKGLKQLQTVSLRGTKVTANGVRELQKSLPTTKITLTEAPARSGRGR